MKKLFAVIIIFLILIGNVGYNTNFSLLDYFQGEYFAYTSTPAGENYIFLGSCYMNYGKIENPDEIIGESMKIYNFEPVAGLESLDANIVYTEHLDSGASVIYAYTDKINRFVKVEDENVNIQIACYDEYSIIGWPLILGSF